MNACDGLTVRHEAITGTIPAGNFPYDSLTCYDYGVHGRRPPMGKARNHDALYSIAYDFIAHCLINANIEMHSMRINSTKTKDPEE